MPKDGKMRFVQQAGKSKDIINTASAHDDHKDKSMARYRAIKTRTSRTTHSAREATQQDRTIRPSPPKIKFLHSETQASKKSERASSLDEAFQAAIKAIVPERLEATRRAKAKMGLSQETTKDDPKVAKFTQITSTDPTPPAAPKLPKAKEKPLLQAAIEHITLDRLHTVLYKALNESPKARSVFERELLAPLSPDPEEEQEAIAAKKKPTRKRPRFEMCRWCKEEFDVTDNPDDACNHHNGVLEQTRPDGFTWDCCQADGDDDGCETTAHEIDEDYDAKKPKRYWES
ncbi:unnamed protein product [Aureobasidium uvarum]|uniref:Uncharacterized protein n=1 Tax=Aureobasidium uvarum TaxID=2773716 RepID=A0A9N8PS56_9PEZI|nr:unnamed protein product [Aureobasidium uvarum]